MLADKKPTFESDHLVSWEFGNIAYLRFKAVDLKSYSSVAFKEEILRHIDRVSKNDSISVAVIEQSTGSHNRANYHAFFESNMKRRDYREAAMRMFNAFQALILSIVRSRTLFIGVLAGEATLQMLLVGIASDYFIVGEDTVFQNPSVELGLVPDCGGGFFLPQRLGRRKAMRLLLQKEDFSAQQALELGLVDQVAPEEELEEATLEIATKLARLPQSSLASMKKLTAFHLRDLEQYFEHESRELDRCMIRSRLLPK